MTIGQDKLMQTGACSETLGIPLRRMAATWRPPLARHG